MRLMTSRGMYGALLCAAVAAPTPLAEPPKLPVPAVDQSAVAQRGYFYVGGKYVGEPGKEIMQGQIYVEVLAPKDVRRPYPLVLIHGAAQTATNWMGTPDGRKGWAEYFVEQGYVVYMIDQPMRGRSAWHPGDGATRMFTAAERGIPVHRHRGQRHLAAGQEAHAVAGRGTGQGPEGRSGVRRVLRDAGRDRHLRRRHAAAQPGRRRRAARQDRPGDRAHPLAVRPVRLADRGCAAAAGQGRSSRSSRRARRSRPPSSAPARRAPGARPTSR